MKKEANKCCHAGGVSEPPMWHNSMIGYFAMMDSMKKDINNTERVLENMGLEETVTRFRSRKFSS
jgi:hypothetical protein